MNEKLGTAREENAGSKIGVECIQSGKYKKEGIPINGMEADEANHPHHNYDNIS